MAPDKKAEKAPAPSAISQMKRIPKFFNELGLEPKIRPRAPYDKQFKLKPPGSVAQKYFDELNATVVPPRFLQERKPKDEFYDMLQVTSDMIVDIQDRHRVRRQVQKDAIDKRNWDRTRRKAEEGARKKAEWEKTQTRKSISWRMPEYQPSSSESSSEGEEVEDLVNSDEDTLLKIDVEDLHKAAVALRNPRYLQDWSIRYDSRRPGGYYNVARPDPKPRVKRRRKVLLH